MRKHRGVRRFHPFSPWVWDRRVMARFDESNTRFTSTRWRDAKVRISTTAGGQKEREAKPRRWWGRSHRNPRDPLSLKISYRGGAECWYEIHARGSIGRFPGHVALHDVMTEINQPPV